MKMTFILIIWIGFLEMEITKSVASSKNDFVMIEDVECFFFHRLMMGQRRNVFLVQSDVEEGMFQNIIREKFLSRVHVHNTKLLEHFAYNIFHTSGDYD